MTEYINYDGACRTAPATPGLLLTLQFQGLTVVSSNRPGDHLGLQASIKDPYIPSARCPKERYA